MVYILYDLSNALLPQYQDVPLRCDPLARISSSGLFIATPFFYRKMRIGWGAIRPENCLAGDAGVERIGSKSQALQVTVRP
jgi:hypothetical protein